MIGLSKLLKEHGAALNADLMDKGFTRSDIGFRLSWADFKDFVQHLSPTGLSAYYRELKPRSWWVTPEYVAIRENTYAVELGNWQRGGGKKGGAQPKPPKIPTDHDVQNISAEEVQDRRKAQSAQLAKARAARGRRKSVKRIDPGKAVTT